jgi:hypothetical protein
VLTDRPSGHRTDRIEIEVHTNADNLTHAAVLSVLLYRDGQAIWHQGRDSAGDIDVAAIELDRGAMPAAVMLRAFTPAHLQHRLQEVKVGTPLLVVGFPLGFTTRCTLGRWCGRPSSRRRSACVSRARVTS